jgi:[acyl-carrier-protein] S-malonyltransferase
MMHRGVTTFYEIGPGRVLSGLIRRINPELEIFNVSGIEDIAQLAGTENRIN